MACWMAALSHHLNLCWRIINKTQRNKSGINITYTIKIIARTNTFPLLTRTFWQHFFNLLRPSDAYMRRESSHRWLKWWLVNVFENAICKIVAILSWPQFVNEVCGSLTPGSSYICTWGCGRILSSSNQNKGSTLRTKNRIVQLIPI